MRIFGITGWKNSGKTTLLERLVRHLRAAGVRVSTVKHAHHGFDLDRPGKDSFRHRAAGAHEVLVSAAGRWALLRELADGAEASLEELLARLEPVDLVLVEGFKGDGHPKLEVVRADEGPVPPTTSSKGVVAFASTRPSRLTDVAGGRPVFALDDVGAIAVFVLENAGPADTRDAG